MMWFAAYSKREGLGIEHRTNIRSVLYGLYILSFMKKQNIKMEGFRIHLLSGSLSAQWQEKLSQESEKRNLYFQKLPDGKCLILATADGYVHLRRMGISMKEMQQLGEQEVFQLLKGITQKGGTANHENG